MVYCVRKEKNGPIQRIAMRIESPSHIYNIILYVVRRSVGVRATGG